MDKKYLSDLKIGETKKDRALADMEYIAPLKTASEQLAGIGRMLVELQSKHSAMQAKAEYEQLLQKVKKEAKDIVELLQNTRSAE